MLGSGYSRIFELTYIKIKDAINLTEQQLLLLYYYFNKGVRYAARGLPCFGTPKRWRRG
jgi:hypothetical protein